jgi:RNA polymerase sigma-70 factor (family 1)
MQLLLRQIQYEHDQAAFKELYQQQVFRLFQFAFSFVKQRQAAEEIVNDVFLKLWQQRHTLHKISNVQVYLYVAVKHTALNYLRAGAPWQQIDLDAVEVQHFHFNMEAEQLLLTNELKKAITAAVNQLPPRCKLIFKLVKEDGLSYKEVAAILDVSVKTVDTQLTIALKKLEQTLKPFLTEASTVAGRKPQVAGGQSGPDQASS